MPQGNPKPGELYLHFKQKMYQVLTVAKHSETGEKLVIYQALYGTFQTYARPLEMFISPVDREKYPKAEQTYRFQLIENMEPEQAESIEENPENFPPQEKTGYQTASQSRQQREGTLTPEEKLMAFFDADSIEEKYRILLEMEDCITDHMINNMAVVLDLIIEDGPVEKRFEELKRCVSTLQKYESTRLR